MKKYFKKINQKLLERLGEKYKLNFIVLFGSQADGTARAASDFDIAYSSQRDISYGEEAFLLSDLARAIKINPKQIDLVNIRNANPLLKKEIADQGVIIKEFVPDSFENFQVYAFKIYVEAKPLFRMQEEYVKRNIV